MDQSSSERVAPFFVELKTLKDVSYVNQIVINARASRKKESDSNWFTIKDPLSDTDTTDDRSQNFYMAFPRVKMCEVSDFIKRYTDKNGNCQPIEMTEVTPGALMLVAEFMQLHMTNKLREIEKPIASALTCLSESDLQWVFSWMPLRQGVQAHYDNWMLFRMLDAAEAFQYDDLTTIVAVVLAECIRGKNIIDLRRFFHERNANGGFTKEEESILLSQCREAWPESRHLFVTAGTGPGATEAKKAGKGMRKIEYIAGESDRKRSWISQSWVLHAALSLLGNQKPFCAAIDLISIDFFNMRHVQRAVRFTQAALHTKKQNEPLDKVILLWKNARMQLKRISPDILLGQLHLVEVDCSIAAETALKDAKEIEKLDDEVSSVMRRLLDAGFAPDEVDFDKLGIETLVDGIARAFNAIGAAWERLGYIIQALKRKRQSLAVFSHVHRGNVHVNVAALLSNVGLLLEMRGERAEAIDFKRRGLEMLRKLTVGRDDERVATAMNNLGVSVQDNGDRQTGIDLQRLALEMRQRLFGQDRDHEKIASSLNNLGAALETSNDRARGIELLRRGLAMNERLHPSGHKNLAMNLANLGSGLMHLGTESALREARALLDRAVTMFTQLRAAHEADGEDIAIAQNNLALVKDRLGDAQGALRDKQKALDIRKAMHEDRDVASVATSMSCVGESLMRLQGQPAESARGQQVLRDAVAMFERLRNYSLEALLAASALFALDATEVTVTNATRLLPMLTQAIELAPSFHRSQLCMSFAGVLEETLPTTANLLRLQRDAAEFAGAAETAKIRSLLARPGDAAAAAVGEAPVDDTPAVPDETAAMWEYVQSAKATRLAAKEVRHVDPTADPATCLGGDDADSVDTAISVAQEGGAKSTSTKTGGLASSGGESQSPPSTQRAPKDKPKDEEDLPSEADVRHAIQNEQQQLAQRMVGEAMAVCIGAAKAVPVMQRAKPADTLAAVRQAISGNTPLTIDLVSMQFVLPSKLPRC